jgi:uncharacterized membrane protein
MLCWLDLLLSARSERPIPKQEDSMRNSPSKNDKKSMAFWICIGVAIGCGIGIAFGNIAYGIGPGVAIGVAIGASNSKARR